ncbi:addiction module antidote protein [Sinorhizobium meliloti]|nr:addiction module antidote protein [Sinorhizobium meliloti]RVG74731.1 putative addiction module antidote protein [Sinorhizobium meliloti]RVI21181.1 putative addiction module antidote protein [Sinorhizobium meliloti]RVI39835.1 putative addiction module antidote protein [Sinorhizobium meliloti]RVJ15994.1 putative addiction module antidote protein [Sinorhizobium meliloti]RVJ87899.1 putative addiction module antidote protein [Sinorhizobium meliloti]
MSIEMTRFDVLDHLKTPEDRFAYLEAALEAGDPSLVAHALGDVARSIGITAVAKDLGVTREALYKPLSEDGDPKLSTLLGVATNRLYLAWVAKLEPTDAGNNPQLGSRSRSSLGDLVKVGRLANFDHV